MSKIRSLPYATPSADRMVVDGWYGKETEEGMIPIGKVLEDWDPAVPIDITTLIVLDVKGIFEDCFLNQDAILRTSATWYSSEAGLRGCGSTQQIFFTQEKQHIRLRNYIDGTNLSKKVELSVTVVLESPGKSPQPFSPRIPGCLLLKRSHTVQLEGEGSRFPIEIIDFAETRLATDAAWSLEWDPSDLEQSVMGDMRLYINSRHQFVKEAVSASNIEGYSVREAIRYDVARTMIYGGLQNESFIEHPDGYKEGSVGYAVSNLIKQYFPEETMEDLSQRVQSPQSFEPKLQARLRLFWRE